MFIFFEDRPSDSPVVERVWRCHSERAGAFHSVAACNWEMVVTRLEGKTSLTIRGPETRATGVMCPGEGEWIAIRFGLGTFMPLLPPSALLDHNDVTLPDASSRSFWLNGCAWEYPDFENAETFVQRLVKSGLIAVDRSVSAALRGQLPELTTRTAQRRFLQTTGVTRRAIHQIERARRATILLQQGVPIIDAALASGYYDQAHLTRSLKRYVGLTPAQILRRERQLSFLYKTSPI